MKKTFRKETQDLNSKRRTMYTGRTGVVTQRDVKALELKTKQTFIEATALIVSLDSILPKRGQARLLLVANMERLSEIEDAFKKASGYSALQSGKTPSDEDATDLIPLIEEVSNILTAIEILMDI